MEMKLTKSQVSTLNETAQNDFQKAQNMGKQERTVITMTQTFTNYLKDEMFFAEMNYAEVFKTFRANHPYGISFTGEYVRSSSAEHAINLYKAEATVNALSAFVRFNGTEADANALFEKYNNAETEADVNDAQNAYRKLCTIRANAQHIV